MTSLGTLWRTVRHLKSSQIVGRARFRLQRPTPDLRPAPPLRTPVAPWVTPARRAASLVGASRFRLLEVERDLVDVGWDDPGIELLWRYNLHYFDDLNAEGAGGRLEWHSALLKRWIGDNPPGRGTGWAPYPVSLRIVNWVKWFMTGTQPEAAWLHSLAVQTRWLAKRLEWHLLGNHLFANAKALVFAGLYFSGEEADRWLAQGLAILAQQLPEQVLPDGGQFERSPMYHALALEDLLDLINLVNAAAPPASPARLALAGFRTRSAAMLHWLRCMTHPGGGLTNFNDNAQGIAPPNTEIERLAAALGIEAGEPASNAVTQLQPSGYLRLARGPAVAWLDVAPIGPDYLPGHAHADTLSFELSLGGQPLIVNRGTSVYGSGARRLLERGTAAHSTVQLGGHDSSEVWSGFRVGRRARPGPVHVLGFEVSGSHDGYRFLPGRPLHERRWRLDEGGLQVEDHLPGAAEAAVARYHLAPGLALLADGDKAWRVTDGAATVARVTVEAGHAELEDWLHAQGFGTLLPAKTLAVRLDGPRACTRWSWGP